MKRNRFLASIRAEASIIAYRTGLDWVNRLHHAEVVKRFEEKIEEKKAMLVELARAEKEKTKGETKCGCRFTDAWRCAVDQNLPSIACRCECHNHIRRQLEGVSDGHEENVDERRLRQQQPKR